MKKIWKIVLITAVAAGILAATCPGKQRHTDAIVGFMSKELQKQANNLVKEYEKQHNNSMPDKGKQALSKLEESLIDQIKPAINKVLVVKNYGLFSLGCLENETDGTTRVTTGILGMIIPSKSGLKTDYNLNINGSR
jgi:hypothetical protein